MKAIIWIVVLGLVAWAGYALLGTESPVPVEEAAAPVSTEPMKLGVIGPFTGDGAAYGEPLRNVIALAVDEINGSGGVNGRELAMIYEDGKCEGTAAANAAQKLVNVDGVKAIIGGFCSSESLAAVPVVEAGAVALLSPGSSSPDLTGRSRFFVRTYPSDAAQGKVLADAAAAKGWKKVAMLQEQKDYPLGITKAFETAFAAAGGTVVKEEFLPDAKDFRSSITKLKAAKPDALFINAQTAAAAGRILKQVNESKWKIALIVNDVVPGDPQTMKDYAMTLEGALTAEFARSNNVKFKALAESYRVKYGADMPYAAYAQTEYDAVYLMRDALAAVGYDGAKIADVLKTVANWDGASGLITIGPDGDRVGGHTLEIIKEGKAEAYAASPAAGAGVTASTTIKVQ